MTAPEFPRSHPYRVAGDEVSEQPPALDPTAFIATLTRIGKGTAADGQPWPERHQIPGRRMALAHADCALAGLRIALEMLLAAERVRQNSPGPALQQAPHHLQSALSSFNAAS